MALYNCTVHDVTRGEKHGVHHQSCHQWIFKKNNWYILGDAKTLKWCWLWNVPLNVVNFLHVMCKQSCLLCLFFATTIHDIDTWSFYETDVLHFCHVICWSCLYCYIMLYCIKYVCFYSIKSIKKQQEDVILTRWRLVPSILGLGSMGNAC